MFPCWSVPQYRVLKATAAPSTLIRCQTKTELFCSVFTKICVHTYRFRIVFARPHYNDHQERSHMESSVRHFRVGWRPVVSILMTSPISDSIVFTVHTRKQRFKKHRFQIAQLWRAFSNDSVFGDRFRLCSVDDSRIRSKTAPFSFESGLVWTGPVSSANIQTWWISNIHSFNKVLIHHG